MTQATDTPAFRAGDWVIISGQTGLVGEKLVGDRFEDQFRQCLANLEAALKTENLARESVAKVNIYLQHMADREQMNRLYAEFFGKHLSARTTVGVSELSRNALVEVEAWTFEAQRS